MQKFAFIPENFTFNQRRFLKVTLVIEEVTEEKHDDARKAWF